MAGGPCRGSCDHAKCHTNARDGGRQVHHGGGRFGFGTKITASRRCTCDRADDRGARWRTGNASDFTIRWRRITSLLIAATRTNPSRLNIPSAARVRAAASSKAAPASHSAVRSPSTPVGASCRPTAARIRLPPRGVPAAARDGRRTSGGRAIPRWPRGQRRSHRRHHAPHRDPA